LSSNSENSTLRVLVLTCTYNERKNIESLVEELHRVSPGADVLVVDDGSPDGTGSWVESQLVKDSHLRLIQRGGKLGLGTAIKRGLQFGIDEGYDFVVNLDADFSHDPQALTDLIRAAINESADLTIGSRYVEGGGLKSCSWRRHLVSRAANALARQLVGWKIRDCSSAYRVYRTSFLRMLDLDRIDCVGYGFLEEILFAFLEANARVIERPIVYTERELGESKISLSEAVGTLKVLWKLRRNRR
jgi:dolichol-phosphate mannosyltransferase